MTELPLTTLVWVGGAEDRLGEENVQHGKLNVYTYVEKKNKHKKEKHKGQ